jgi:hypothetical protein
MDYSQNLEEPLTWTGNTKNPCCVWDFTLFDMGGKIEEVIALCRKYAKAWCFQEEMGKVTGHRHLQGRVSLKEKTRSLWFGPNLKMYARVTSNENKGNMFYVMKEDTRINGPWADSGEYEVVYVPRDVREIQQLYLWQAQLKDIAVTYERRKINIIYDPIGNIGKSMFVRIMRVYKLARKIPFANDYRDIMRMVMDMPESKCYMFDLPRAISKEKLFQFFSAIEEIKSGYAFDDRYHFQERIFDPPAIIIFMNVLPDRSLLSGDRWNILRIKDGALVSGETSGFCNNIDTKGPEQLEQFDETAIEEGVRETLNLEMSF